MKPEVGRATLRPIYTLLIFGPLALGAIGVPVAAMIDGYLISSTQEAKRAQQWAISLRAQLDNARYFASEGLTSLSGTLSADPSSLTVGGQLEVYNKAELHDTTITGKLIVTGKHGTFTIDPDNDPPVSRVDVKTDRAP